MLVLWVAACGGAALDPAIPDGGNSDAGVANAGVKVGFVADLTTRQHGVRGRITVVDATTLSVSGFDYDGGGLSDVRFYGAKGGHYAQGFALGPQLAIGAQSNRAFTFQLPAGRTLADLDGLAVWCVSAGVGFGDGLFHAP